MGIQGRAVARGIHVYSKERLASANLGGGGEGIARRGSRTRTRWERGRRCGGSEEDVGDATEHADVEAGGPSAVVVRDVDLQYGANRVRAGRGSEESPEEGTIQGRRGGSAGVAGAWFGANRLGRGKRKWGGRLLQAGRQATGRQDVEGVADVG